MVALRPIHVRNIEVISLSRSVNEGQVCLFPPKRASLSFNAQFSSSVSHGFSGICFSDLHYTLYSLGKMTGNDRKLQVALEQSLQDQLGSPNSERLSISPFGPLSDRLSRQTLIYLITTLNCAFPYYDFSYVPPGPQESGHLPSLPPQKARAARTADFELSPSFRPHHFPSLEGFPHVSPNFPSLSSSRPFAPLLLDFLPPWSH